MNRVTLAYLRDLAIEGGPLQIFAMPLGWFVIGIATDRTLRHEPVLWIVALMALAVVGVFCARWDR